MTYQTKLLQEFQVSVTAQPMKSGYDTDRKLIVFVDEKSENLEDLIGFPSDIPYSKPGLKFSKFTKALQEYARDCLADNTLRLYFSWKAGCDVCECSPGFVATDLSNEYDKGANIEFLLERSEPTSISRRIAIQTG